MSVPRQLADGEGDSLDAQDFTRWMSREPDPRSRSDDRPATQIGQTERASAVAAVGRAKKGEQSGILGDRQQLAVAEGPAIGGESAGEQGELAQEVRIADIHILRGKLSLDGNDIAQRERRLQIVKRLSTACYVGRAATRQSVVVGRQLRFGE